MKKCSQPVFIKKIIVGLILSVCWMQGSAQKSLGISFHPVYFNQVIFVFKKGPGDKAGIRVGDMVTKVNGSPISQNSLDGFISYLRTLPDQVTLEVHRDGNLQTLTIAKTEVASFVNTCVSGDCINGIGIYNGGAFSYEGSFAKGVRHGSGTLYFGNGDIYKGEMNNGIIEGKGKLITAELEYEGTFANNAYEGSGKLTLKGGDVLTAVFSKNSIVGTAKMKYKNGDTYEGGYKDYKRNGFGVLRYAGGAVYEGDFVSNARHGEGKMTQADKFIYEGTFSNDSYEGKGKLIYPNGNVYTGNFKDNKPDGPGRMLYKNGDVYEGLFTSYDKTGKGKYWFKDGRYYEGDFLNDKKNGKGKFAWPNGNTYEGDFVNDERSGMGRYYDKQKNTTVESLWSEDKVVPLLDPAMLTKKNEQHNEAVKGQAVIFEKAYKEMNKGFAAFKGTDSIIKNGIVFYDFKGPRFWDGFPTLFKNPGTGKLVLSYEIQGSDQLKVLAVKQSVSSMVVANGLQSVRETKMFNGEETGNELYKKGDRLYFGITEFPATKKVVVALYE